MCFVYLVNRTQSDSDLEITLSSSTGSLLLASTVETADTAAFLIMQSRFSELSCHIRCALLSVEWGRRHFVLSQTFLRPAQPSGRTWKYVIILVLPFCVIQVDLTAHPLLWQAAFLLSRQSDATGVRAWNGRTARRAMWLRQDNQVHSVDDFCWRSFLEPHRDSWHQHKYTRFDWEWNGIFFFIFRWNVSKSVGWMLNVFFFSFFKCFDQIKTWLENTHKTKTGFISFTLCLVIKIRFLHANTKMLTVAHSLSCCLWAAVFLVLFIRWFKLNWKF